MTEMQYLDLTMRIIICLAIIFETIGVVQGIKGIWGRIGGK